MFLYLLDCSINTSVIVLISKLVSNWVTTFGVLVLLWHFEGFGIFFFLSKLKFILLFCKAGSSAPLYIEQTEETETNITDSTELYEDGQLLGRSKAIATKTKEIEQVSLGILSLIEYLCNGLIC